MRHVLSLVCAALVGCSTIAEQKTVLVQVSKEQIVSTLFQNGMIMPAGFDDAIYSLPSVNWVTAQLSILVRDAKRLSKTEKYAVESNDCDDMVSLAKVAANGWNVRNGLVGLALATAKCDYTKDNGDRHSVLAVVCADNRVVFYDAIIERVVELSDSERMLAVLSF